MGSERAWNRAFSRRRGAAWAQGLRLAGALPLASRLASPDCFISAPYGLMRAAARSAPWLAPLFHWASLLVLPEVLMCASALPPAWAPASRSALALTPAAVAAVAKPKLTTAAMVRVKSLLRTCWAYCFIWDAPFVHEVWTRPAFWQAMASE